MQSTWRCHSPPIMIRFSTLVRQATACAVSVRRGCCSPPALEYNVASDGRAFQESKKPPKVKSEIVWLIVPPIEIAKKRCAYSAQVTALSRCDRPGALS